MNKRQNKVFCVYTCMKDLQLKKQQTMNKNQSNFEDTQRVIEYIYIWIIVDFLQQFNDADFLRNIFARLF